MPPKKPKPRTRARNEEFGKRGPGRGRTVLQPVTCLPEDREGKRGPKPDKYHGLFTQIIADFGAHQPVKVVEFSNRSTAYKVARKIRDGESPVPGGVERWTVRALEEWVEGNDVGVKGSALYVEWLGPA